MADSVFKPYWAELEPPADMYTSEEEFKVPPIRMSLFIITYTDEDGDDPDNDIKDSTEKV